MEVLGKDSPAFPAALEIHEKTDSTMFDTLHKVHDARRRLLPFREAEMSQGILIADDSSTVRRVIHNYLAERNFHVCGEAVDGEDAIEKTRELKPDLILLDLAMPRANGIVVASVLKEMMPSVRIVLFTMYSEAVRKTFTALNGIDAMVDKSDGMGKLMKCVHNLLSTSAETHRD